MYSRMLTLSLPADRREDPCCNPEQPASQARFGRGAITALLLAALLAGIAPVTANASALVTTELPLQQRERFELARKLYDSNQHDEALSLYRKLADELPGQPEPFNNIAVIEAERGNIDAAREMLLAAFSSHPGFETVYANLQTIHARLASEAYRKALNPEPEGTATDAAIVLSRAERLHWMAPAAEQVAVIVPPPPIEIVQPDPLPTPLPTAVPTSVSPEETATITGDPAREVLKTVNEWADAWSDQQVDRYLAFYIPDYAPEGLTHQQWVVQRNIRLARPGYIRLDLSGIQVRVLSDDRAEVIFNQEYSADTYRDQVLKRLKLVRNGRLWLIEEELSIKSNG
jgi:hypothetical protein